MINKFWLKFWLFRQKLNWKLKSYVTKIQGIGPYNLKKEEEGLAQIPLKKRRREMGTY